MTNGGWLVGQGYKFNDLILTPDNDGSGFTISLDGKILGHRNGAKLDVLMAWLDEDYHPNIVTPSEKAYLNMMLAPFKNQVTYIGKTRVEGDVLPHLFLITTGDSYITFPAFTEDWFTLMDWDAVYPVERIN